MGLGRGLGRGLGLRLGLGLGLGLVRAMCRMRPPAGHATQAYYRLTRGPLTVHCTFGVDEGDVVAGGAAPDAAGREAHALALQVLHRYGQLVDPEANVVECGHLDILNIT